MCTRPTRDLQNVCGGDKPFRKIRVWRQGPKDPEPGKKMLTVPAQRKEDQKLTDSWVRARTRRRTAP